MTPHATHHHFPTQHRFLVEPRHNRRRWTCFSISAECLPVLLDHLRHLLTFHPTIHRELELLLLFRAFVFQICLEYHSQDLAKLRLSSVLFHLARPRPRPRPPPPPPPPPLLRICR